MRRLLSFVAVGFAVHSALGGISGCSSADPVKKTAPASGKKGTLSLALQTVSQSGKVYRLRFATFFVNPSFFFPTPPPTGPGPIVGTAGKAGGSVQFPDAGVAAGGAPSGFFDGGVATAGSTGIGGGFFGGSDGGIIIGSGGLPGLPGGGFFGGAGFPGSPGSGSFTLSSEDDINSPVIEKFLAPGGYEIDLFPGWFIEQVDTALGTSVQVPATLQSSEFQFFNITSDQESFVRFDFLVDGSSVTFGSPGRLGIGIGITETNGSAFCGDGVMEAGEDCDGPDLGGQNCATVTMGSAPSGTLFCSKDCRFDTTFCQGGFIDGGTGGFGTGGFGAAGGGVGLPPADAGMGPAAGGAGGKGPIP
jgi:hypothetical protein